MGREKESLLCGPGSECVKIGGIKKRKRRATSLRSAKINNGMEKKKKQEKRKMGPMQGMNMYEVMHHHSPYSYHSSLYTSYVYSYQV